jgi:hypothetical protein
MRPAALQHGPVAVSGGGGGGGGKDDLAKQSLANKIDLAEALSAHAKLYHSLGMSHKAAPLLRRSHAILKEALGPHDDDTVRMLNEVAAACTATGRYAEALEVYREIEASLNAHADLMDQAASAPVATRAPSSSKGVSLLRKHVNEGNAFVNITRQATMKKLGNNARAALGVVLSNQGAMLVHLGRPTEALQLLKRASEHVKQQQQQQQPESSSRGGFGVALDANLTLEGSGSQGSKMAAKTISASLLNNTAAAYLTLGNAARAAELLASPEDAPSPPSPFSQLQQQQQQQKNVSYMVETDGGAAADNQPAVSQQQQQQLKHDPQNAKLLAASLTNLAQAQSRGVGLCTSNQVDP